MDQETTTIGGIGGVIVVAIVAVVKYGGRAALRIAVRELALWILAASERSRRRDRKQRSERPASTRRTPAAGVPTFVDPTEETTDIFELVEIERKDRARRDTEQKARGRRDSAQPPQREQPRVRGERPPRPGTHHDRED